MLIWQPVSSEEIQFLYTVDLGETSSVGRSVLASFTDEICFTWAPPYVCLRRSEDNFQVSSILLCGFGEQNSGLEAWQKVPLSAWRASPFVSFWCYWLSDTGPVVCSDGLYHHVNSHLHCHPTLEVRNWDMVLRQVGLRYNRVKCCLSSLPVLACLPSKM